MAQTPIGLHDLALYVPESALSMETLLRKRIAQDPNLEKHLNRAVQTTGQTSMRYPQLWEDTITLAAQACRSLLDRNADLPRDSVRFLTLGTETSVDMSKAGSSYVLGALSKAGYRLPATLSTFQVQHACAGGALSMLTLAGYLQSAGRDEDSAIVMTSDIARYNAPSTAEVTQGAGASALLVKKNPNLLEFDLSSTGFYSKDVDDFFRPLGSVVAKVKGGFSVSCYHESLIGAFEDHCARLGTEPDRELDSIDLFCLHVPYSLMPLGAMEKLLAKHKNFDAAQTREFLEKRGFFASLEPTAKIGNLYTGSLFLSLAFSLKERYAVFRDSIVGKKVLMASYGSGNTMAVWTSHVAENAPKTIASWNLDALVSTTESEDFEAYQAWLDTVKTPENYAALLQKSRPKKDRFYLASLREDGYREYSWE